jgi:iron(III) transport system permease protein
VDLVKRAVAPAALPASRTFATRMLEPHTLLMAACIALVGYLALVPLGFLAWQSVQDPAAPGGEATLTLRHYAVALSSAQAEPLFVNSLLFASGTAVFAFALGTALAWLNERTNTPFRRLFFALALAPLVIPGILFAVAWMLLASPRIGMLNVLLQRWLDTDFVLLDVYSLPGMIFVDGLHYSPMAFLMMGAAFRTMDPALEEAALTSGASRLQTFRLVVLPLASPAAFATLLLVFVRAIESFEVPALIGIPAGVPVFTSAIYDAVHRYPSRIGLASAHAVVLLAVAAIGLWLQARIAARGAAYATTTGRGGSLAVIDLGRGRYLAAAFFLLYLALVVILPFAVLAWSSLQTFYSVPSAEAVERLSLQPYRSLLDHPAIGRAVFNSIVLAIAAATIVVAIATVVAWIVARSRARGRALLDVLATSPVAIPGVVLGLALMVFHLEVPIGLYGTLGILVVAYVTRFLPYGVRYASASVLAIHREIEEAAATSGASWFTSLRRVLLPLMRPALLAAWIHVAIVSMRELGSSVLLYAPGTEVVSVVIWELWENGQYGELSALGVLFIVALVVLIVLARPLSERPVAR